MLCKLWGGRLGDTLDSHGSLKYQRGYQDVQVFRQYYSYSRFPEGEFCRNVKNVLHLVKISPRLVMQSIFNFAAVGCYIF